MHPDIAPTDVEVSAGSLRLHARIWPGPGQTIILLHGLASSAQIWNLTAPLLARSFRVVALDQRGHAASDKPDDGYDFATIIGDLDRALTALAITRPVLVGHSWGGNVALDYAASHPDNVSHLVLVDGGFLELQMRDGMTWEVTEKQLAPPDISMPLPAFLERMRTRLGSIYSESARDAVLGNLYLDERGVVRPHLTRERHMLILRALWEHRPSLLYGKVTCPTLLIPAEPADLLSDPERLREKRRSVALAEQRLRRSKVVWMHETIHDIPLHRPAALAEAIVGFVKG